MKRGLEIITAIIVILIVIGALLVASKRGTLDKNRNIFNWTDDREFKEVTKELEISDKLLTFDLDIPNTSLEILNGDTDKVKVTCSGKNNYNIEQKGSNISIEKERYKFSLFNWGNFSEKVIIVVPSDAVASYFADMSNGDINISGIIATNIEIDTSNGEINFYDIQVNNEIEVSTSNGTINIEKITANKMKFDSSNGKANVKNIKADEITIDTSNGSINAYECYGREVELDTSNGSITLENLEDKDFIINELETSTSNGHENINANYKYKK